MAAAITPAGQPLVLLIVPQLAQLPLHSEHLKFTVQSDIVIVLIPEAEEDAVGLDVVIAPIPKEKAIAAEEIAVPTDTRTIIVLTQKVEVRSTEEIAVLL